MGSLPLTREQRQMAHRLRAKGLTMRAIAKDFGCTSGGVCDIVNGKRVGPRAYSHSLPAADAEACVVKGALLVTIPVGAAGRRASPDPE